MSKMLTTHYCLRCGAFIHESIKQSCEPFCSDCEADPKPPVHPWWIRTDADKRAFGVRR